MPSELSGPGDADADAGLGRTERSGTNCRRGTAWRRREGRFRGGTMNTSKPATSSVQYLLLPPPRAPTRAQRPRYSETYRVHSPAGLRLSTSGGFRVKAPPRSFSSMRQSATSRRNGAPKYRLRRRCRDQRKQFRNQRCSNRRGSERSGECLRWPEQRRRPYKRVAFVGL